MAIQNNSTVFVNNGLMDAEYFKAFGSLWTISHKGVIGGGRHRFVEGPYCQKEGCGYPIPIDDNYAGSFPVKVKCTRCNAIRSFTKSPAALKTEVSYLYDAKLRESWPVTSLDSPPTDVKTRDQDDKYWIATKIGEKNGKRVGVVYIGEKKSDQTKEDYAQVFLDLDDEQVRVDPSNKPPHGLLSKAVIEFKDSTHEINYEK